LGAPGAEEERVLVVEGLPLQVSVNLYDIVQHMSPRWPWSKYIWVDRLCINQRDIAEKAIQVRRMREIYRNAARVVVWLGHSDDGHVAVRQLHRVFMTGYLSAIPILGPLLAACAFWLVCNGRRDPAPWEALRGLFASPWFSRVWVLQEVAVARDVRVVYGGDTFPWAVLYRAAMACHNERGLPYVTQALVYQRETDRVWLKPPGLDHAEAFNTYRACIRVGYSIDPASLFRRCRGFTATDPRDKIFALLGLVDAYDHPRLKVDYGKSAHDVMVDAARYFLERNELCDVLFEAGIGWDCGPTSVYVESMDEARTLASLPTWVPNWAKGYYGAKISRLVKASWGDAVPSPGYNYAASGIGQGAVMREGHCRSLIARVVLVGDTVARLGSVCRVPLDERESAASADATVNALQWYVEAWRLVMEAAIAPYPVRGGEQSPGEAFWRTCVGDRTTIQRPAPPFCARIFRRTLQGLAADLLKSEDPAVLGTLADDVRAMFEGGGVPVDDGGSSPDEARLERGTDVTLPTINKRLCVTDKGFIGLVPPATREGDELCIILGSQTPSVIRRSAVDDGYKRAVAPEEDDGEDWLREYCLVGESYVHGMMDGEMMCKEKGTGIRIW
jgi:hypothetical protein